MIQYNWDQGELYEKMYVFFSFYQFKPDGSIDKEKDKGILEEMIKDEELRKKYLNAIEECDVSGTNHLFALKRF